MKKKKVFHSLLVSYTLILILPLLMSGLVYFYTLKNLNQQLGDVCQLSVQQIQKITDSEISAIQKVSNSVLLQSEVNSLKYQKTYPFPTKKIEQLKELQDYLSGQVAANSLIADIYVNFRNSNTILSVYNIFYADEFTTQCRTNLQMNYEDYRKALDFDGYRQYKIVDNGDRRSVMIFQKNGATTKERSADVVVTVLLNTVQLEKLLSQLGEEGVQGAILGENGMIFSSAEYTEEPYFDYDTLAGNSDVSFFSKVYRKETITARIASEAAPWSYSFTLPMDTYADAVKTQIIFMLSGTLVSLLVGILLCCYMSKRQYEPVKHLLEKVSGNSEQALNWNLNEYMILDQSISNILEEQQISQQELKKYNFLVRERLIRDLLTGNTTYLFRHSKSKELEDLSLIYDNFFVVLFGVVYDPVKCPPTAAVPSAVILSYIQNAVPAMLGKEAVVHSVTVKDQAVCLINVSDEYMMEEDFFWHFTQNLSALQQYIKEETGMGVYTTVSDVHYSLDSIATAYQEVLDVQEYYKIVGNEDAILFYSQVNINDFANDTLPELLEQERILIQLFKTRDFEKAKEVFHEIIHEISEHKQCSLKQTKLRMASLVTTLTNAMEEIRNNVYHTFYEDVNPIPLLYHSESLQELEENMNSVFDALLSYFSQNKGGSSKRNEELVQYVNEHYADPSISVVQVADRFHLSSSYVSRSFKKLTGYGFLDYVHLKRISKAKEYLAQDYLVKDIAEQLGYTNSLALIRAFRRYEGMAPSEYRESIKAEGEKKG